MLGASATLALTVLTSVVDAQPGRGGGRGGGFGGPRIGGPGFGGPGIGVQGNFGGANRGFSGWNQPGWGNRGFYGNPGVSIWYSPYGTWNVPMSGRGYGVYDYVTPSYVVPAPSTTTVVPAEASTQYGLQITRVFDGGAKKADLRTGDVILGIGQTRTESFEALQAALVGAKEVEIVFLNNESKKVEKLPVKVDDGKIGVEVVPVVMQ
jgi:hypothetical protein